MSTEKAIESAIALSRRNFLFGAAATLAAAALPSLPEPERLKAILVDAQAPFLRRHINQMSYGGLTQHTVDFGIRVSLFVRNMEVPIHSSAMNARSTWLWCSMTWEDQPIILGKDFYKLTVEPFGDNVPDELPPANVYTCFWEEGEDKLWRSVIEAYEFPSGNKQRNLLDIEAYDTPPWQRTRESAGDELTAEEEEWLEMAEDEYNSTSKDSQERYLRSPVGQRDIILPS